MSRISIDKPLTPGENATFVIDMSFFGYSKEVEFKIKVPRAAPRLNKVNNILVTNRRGADRERTKGDYGFSRYVRGENIRGPFYILKVRLNNLKDANQLSPGDLINLSSTDPKLAALNTKNYEVLDNNNKNKRYVNLRVNIADQPTPTSASVSGSSLQEITGIFRTRRYTVSLPPKVFRGLISERIPGKGLQKGMVEDIPIYAFKRFKGQAVASVPRKLMNSGANINEKVPPDRNQVTAFIGKRSYFRDFIVDNEEKFIFYVSIARYIYDGEKWNKQWVQTNASKNAVWGKAVERK